MSALSRIPGLLDDLRKARAGAATVVAASQAEVDAGTNTTKFVNPSTLAGMTGNLPAPDFTSSEQTVTADTVLNVAHGLGALPTFVTVVLRNKTTEHGYSVNDEVYIFPFGSGADEGCTAAADATNVTITQGLQFVILSQSTFNGAPIAVSKWKWVVRAWK